MIGLKETLHFQYSKPFSASQAEQTTGFSSHTRVVRFKVQSPNAGPGLVSDGSFSREENRAYRSDDRIAFAASAASRAAVSSPWVVSNPSSRSSTPASASVKVP